MLQGKIIAVCSEIHTKHTTLPVHCGQNVEFLNQWYIL
jgi:hypothetical protein